MPRFSLFRRALCLCVALCLLAGCGASSSSSQAGQPASSVSSAASSPEAEKPQTAPQSEGELFPQGEYRAVWISYLEWENVDFSSEESFTRDVGAMLDNCVDLGLNVVLAQVRPFGDALYPSELFPFSHLCTGTQGQDPGYDPLAILVEMAHERDLEIEAWINPYRLQLSENIPDALADSNLANTHPEWVRQANGGLYLDPASEDVRAYITAGVLELVENYGLDGIHLDDYFYPTTDPAFDQEEYAACGTTLSLEDWRRENVNQLVRALYAAVHQAGGGSVRFGISPQGNNDNNYNGQYSDLGLWLSQPGYLDYAAPQLYWGNGHQLSSGSDRFAFENVAAEWLALERDPQVRLIFGLGAYRIGEGDGCDTDLAFWQSGSALAQQAALGRELGADGFALYRYDSLFRNTGWEELAASEAAALTQLP